MMMMVMVVVYVHESLAARNTSLGDLCHSEVVMIKAKLGNLGLEHFDVETCIQQGSENHVSAGTGEAVEICDFHGTLLLATEGDSLASLRHGL